MRKFLTEYAQAKRKRAHADYFARHADPHAQLKALWRASTWGLIRDWCKSLQPRPAAVRAFIEGGN